MGAVMDVPVVAATRLKGHIAIALNSLFISRKVFGSNGCKMAVANEILGVSGVGIALGPVAEPEVCFVEIDNLVPWDIVAIAPVVQVAVGSIGYNQQTLVVGILATCDFLISLLAEVSAVSLLAVDDKYGSAYLVGCNPQVLIEEHERRGDVPSHVRVERTGMVATCSRLVVGNVLLEEVWCVRWSLGRQSALWKYLSLAIFLSALLSQPNIIIDKTIFLISAAKAQIIPETCIIQISGIITIFMENVFLEINNLIEPCYVML